MAYEKKTWVCGETITADGLNNIEEGVQEALECCGGGGSSLKYVADVGDSGAVVENAVEGAIIVYQGQQMVVTEEMANKATSLGSHAEGLITTASGEASHAEGSDTTASGSYSHAEGLETTASEQASHAEGTRTTASGISSHAQNNNTIAQGHAQTAIGSYNEAQGTPLSAVQTDYAFIIGNGSSNTNRSNALAIKWDGTFVFANGTEITPAQFASLLALLQ